MAGNPQRKKGSKKKLSRSTRNKQSGKYARQRIRTEANKAKRRKKNQK